MTPTPQIYLSFDGQCEAAFRFYEQPKGFQIFLDPDDPEETERLFDALAENGTTQMPLQQTFWSVRFGVLTDQFGIPWTLNCAQAPELAT